MPGKGLDFKHKEVINIIDGRRLRVCTGCNSWFRKWSYNKYDGATKENNNEKSLLSNNDIYNCSLKENRYPVFIFDRDIVKNSYITNKNHHRKGHVIKHKFEYEIVCKVEI